MPSSDSRTESQVFTDLAELCKEPGYVHVIAYFCFRDSVIAASGTGDLAADDVSWMYSTDRLIRTEVATLIGLMVKAEIDLSIPPPNVFQKLVNRTEALLEELHQCLSLEFMNILEAQGPDSNPFTVGSVLRESIFYNGEAAYIFQYRELSIPKYKQDNDWLETTQGFSIEDAQAVVRAIQSIQNRRFPEALRSLMDAHPQERTILSAFKVSTSEIEEVAGLPPERVTKILQVFSLVPGPDTNADFRELSDFNAVCARPLIEIAQDRYLVLQQYSLAEALYESPFYWMLSDLAYADQASAHRGAFAEQFATQRLKTVFGEERVWSNVSLLDSNGQPLGEIDCLVLFADRAIVVQGKSKRLTLDARRGNDKSIRDDFRRSVQDAYDQGLSCARLLQTHPCNLVGPSGEPLQSPASLSEVYIVCLVTDHYPALSFQARQFLQFETSGSIPPPFVMDVFFLDVMTEMLSTPLHLLAYMNRRTFYGDRVWADHELTVLSYHLKQNLWIHDEVDQIRLGNDLCADLDIAITARREGFLGATTPDGILTHLQGTCIGSLVATIEASEDPTIVDLGFWLLALDEESAVQISDQITAMFERCRQDGQHHDLVVDLGSARSGLTVHCNSLPEETGGPSLFRHCERRKYMAAAKTWYGICIDPYTESLRYGCGLAYDWAFSPEMEEAIRPASRPYEQRVNLHSASQKCPLGK